MKSPLLSSRPFWPPLQLGVTMYHRLPKEIKSEVAGYRINSLWLLFSSSHWQPQLLSLALGALPDRPLLLSPVPPPDSAGMCVLCASCPELQASPPESALVPLYLLFSLLGVSFLGPASPLPFPPAIAPDDSHSAFWTPRKCSLF